MNPRLIVATLLMCVALIHASAVMHLSNVGMGSTDWPASYGQIAEEGQQTGMEAGRGQTASAAITPEAIAGRIHRAVASILQILIIAIAVIAFMKRKVADSLPLLVPMLALVLSLFLAFLGVWYGSPLRYPWIMIINRTGGFALLGLFWWLTLDFYGKAEPHPEKARWLKPWAVAGLFVVIIQIALGAWVDAYYAALACTGFPDCPGVHWSGVDLLRGFTFLGNMEVDASGKVIVDQSAAAAIHMTHRIGAVVTLLYIGWLGWCTLGLGGKFRSIGIMILAILAAQLGLGVAIVLLSMPLALVVAHTVNSALLVLGILTLIHHRTWAGRQPGDI